jgi:hypothetical protein
MKKPGKTSVGVNQYHRNYDAQAQITFIVDRLRKGMERRDILKDWEQFHKTSTKTFDIRLGRARMQVIGETSRINEGVDKYVKDKSAELGYEIMSIAERVHVLAQIAKGLIEIESPFVVGESVVMQKCKPSFADRKSAIAELNKMDGAYATIKAELNVFREQPLFPDVNYIIDISEPKTKQIKK